MRSRVTTAPLQGNPRAKCLSGAQEKCFSWVWLGKTPAFLPETEGWPPAAFAVANAGLGRRPGQAPSETAPARLSLQSCSHFATLAQSLAMIEFRAGRFFRSSLLRGLNSRRRERGWQVSKMGRQKPGTTTGQRGARCPGDFAPPPSALRPPPSALRRSEVWGGNQPGSASVEFSSAVGFCGSPTGGELGGDGVVNGCGGRLVSIISRRNLACPQGATETSARRLPA